MPDEKGRLGAARAFISLAVLQKNAFSKQVVDDLAASLKDKSVDVRIYVAFALGRLGPTAKPALPALFEAAKDTGNIGTGLRQTLPSGVAQAAIDAAICVDPTCMAALAKAILPDLTAKLTSKDEGTLQAACFALGRLGEHASPAVAGLQDAKTHATGFAADRIRGILDSLAGDSSRMETIANSKAPEAKRIEAIKYYHYGRKADDKVILEVIKALKDPSVRVRAAAVETIDWNSSRAKAAIPVLIDLLADMDLAEVPARYAAISDCVPHALHKMGKEALPGLIGVVQNRDKSTLHRYRALRVLTDLGRKAKAAKPVFEAGMKDKILPLAIESAYGYALLNGDMAAALPLFREGLKSESLFVLWNTAHSIEKLGDRARATVPDLIPLLSHKEREIRIAAARGICTMGPAAIPAIKTIANLLNSKDPRERFQIADAFEKLGPNAKDALPILVQRLRAKDLDQIKPQPVLTVIGNLGPAAAPAVPALLDLLDQKRSIFRNQVIDVLGEIGPAAKPAAPRLISLLEDPNRYTRSSAAGALGKIGPEAKVAVPALQNHLDDKDASVRISAASALALVTRDAKPQVEFLIQMWNDELPDPLAWPTSMPIRFGVAGALSELGPNARPARDLLLDAVSTMRDAMDTPFVPKALGNLHEDADLIVPKLVALFDNKAPDLTRMRTWPAAIEILGMLGPKAKAAVPRLRQLLDDDEDDVANAAAKALKRIEGK